MSADTTPPVGTIMKYRSLRGEVLGSSPEYLVAQGEGDWFALRLVDGEWRDHVNDVWEIDTPEPPTLPVGTVLTHGLETRKVAISAPELAMAVDDDGDVWALAWIDNAWRCASGGRAWEVQP